MHAAPPEVLRAKASVTADWGLSPPSSGAVKQPGPLCIFPGQRHSYSFPLGPGVPGQLGEGWEAGQQASSDPPEERRGLGGQLRSAQ